MQAPRRSARNIGRALSYNYDMKRSQSRCMIETSKTSSKNKGSKSGDKVQSKINECLHRLNEDICRTEEMPLKDYSDPFRKDLEQTPPEISLMSDYLDRKHQKSTSEELITPMKILKKSSLETVPQNSQKRESIKQKPSAEFSNADSGLGSTLSNSIKDTVVQTDQMYPNSETINRSKKNHNSEEFLNSIYDIRTALTTNSCSERCNSEFLNTPSTDISSTVTNRTKNPRISKIRNQNHSGSLAATTEFSCSSHKTIPNQRTLQQKNYTYSTAELQNEDSSRKPNALTSDVTNALMHKSPRRDPEFFNFTEQLEHSKEIIFQDSICHNSDKVANSAKTLEVSGFFSSQKLQTTKQNSGVSLEVLTNLDSIDEMLLNNSNKRQGSKAKCGGSRKTTKLPCLNQKVNTSILEKPFKNILTLSFEEKEHAIPQRYFTQNEMNVPFCKNQYLTENSIKPSQKYASCTNSSAPALANFAKNFQEENHFSRLQFDDIGQVHSQDFDLENSGQDFTNQLPYYEKGTNNFSNISQKPIFYMSHQTGKPVKAQQLKDPNPYPLRKEGFMESYFKPKLVSSDNISDKTLNNTNAANSGLCSHIDITPNFYFNENQTSILPDVYPDHFSNQLTKSKSNTSSPRLFKSSSREGLFSDFSSESTETSNTPSVPDSLQDIFESNDIRKILNIEKVVYSLTHTHIRLLAITLNMDFNRLITILDSILRLSPDTLNRINSSLDCEDMLSSLSLPRENQESCEALMTKEKEYHRSKSPSVFEGSSTSSTENNHRFFKKQRFQRD